MEKTKISVHDLNLYYGENHALKNVSMDIKEKAITAFIGPSGCGKSTFLKTLNRMNDLVDNVRIDGSVQIDGEDIYAKGIDTTMLRKKVGMVFQQPNPFPMSIYDNVAYGPRVHGIKDKKRLDQLVEESLRGAAIWDEVKDRLKKSALSLSGGQQQRICIARALAVEPEILLMDEPTSALDPISTTKIEDLMEDLKKKYTVVVVTHNMQQAVRVSDYTAFFLVGEMVEFGETKQIFSYPKDKRTEDYIRKIWLIERDIHMRNKFNEQLLELNKEMIEMGNKIIDSIKMAIAALESSDTEKAKRIMEGDAEIDRLQKKIENICFNLLIQQQPVATDLRNVTAAMKMVTDMERIGDHAADISEITILMGQESRVDQFEHIAKMANETMIMLNHSIEAYVEKDAEKARRVIEHDDIVDALFDAAKKDVIQLILDDSGEGEEATDLLMIAKYFERIGDHATNIAEWVIFSLTTSADSDIE